MQRLLKVFSFGSVNFAHKGGTECRAEYTLRCDGAACVPSWPRIEDSRVSVEFLSDGIPVAVVSDDFTLDDGFAAVRRRWTLALPGSWILEASFSAAFHREPELMIPSVMYRDNSMGKGAFPSRRESASWSFLETRTPLPGCVHWHGEGRSFSVAAAEAGKGAADADRLGTGSWRFADGRAYALFALPGREAPFAYTGKSSRTEPDSVAYGIVVSEATAPVIVERTFYCRCATTEGDSAYGSYRRFLVALEGVGEYPGGEPSDERPAPQKAAWDEYASLKAAHLLSLVEAADGGDEAFLAMGRRNGTLQDVYGYTAGSFLVKSLEGALVLCRLEADGAVGADVASAPFRERLAASFGLKDSPGLLAAVAERIGRFFLRGEIVAGVHQDGYDIRRGLWGGYLGISEDDSFRQHVNARCNGEAMKAYIQLYGELAERGRVVPEFIDLPKRVASFYIEHQFDGDLDGCFGRWWSVDGKPVNVLGTNGAYVASFLITLEAYFDDRPALAAALDRAGRYYGGLADRGEFYGDTLDADCFDKEAGAALLSMFLDYYERDGDPKMLSRAREAADFVLTWIWQYDCPFPRESPLGLRDFHTVGMTSVSVAHHHLDFYGMSIAYDFLRLSEFSGNAFYASQARRMLRASLQLVASPRDLLGRKREDLGWQPEQINHTAWDYFDRVDHHSGHFGIDIAWVTVLGLGAYQRIQARYPEALG